MVTMPGAVRRQVLAASALACLALAGATACSSSGSSSAAPSQPASSAQQQNDARYATAPALLAQCAFSHGVQAELRSAQQYNSSHSKSQQWLFGTMVQLTAANGSGFTDWFDNGGGAAVTLGGQQVGDWQQWAADHGELPAQVCGTAAPGAAVRQLYKKVYAHWPSMLSSNPW